MLRLHILPELGTTPIGKLTTGQVRTWRAAMVKAGQPGASTITKCYRLLHAICATAVEDSLIARHPCVIRRASVERPEERPVATIREVFALADAIEPRYRAMGFLATFCGLRVGELRALRQRNLDVFHRRVTVTEQYQQLADGTLILGPPKTDAGRRSVADPRGDRSELEHHLSTWCTPGKDKLVFPGASGRPFRTATLQAAWHRALKATGIEGLRFHDLRHTGNTLAAATGASTKELMARMGHAPRAALIYQHATKDRDAAIAAGPSALIEQTCEDARS